MLINLTTELEQKLTTSERMVIDFINENENELDNLSIVEIGDLTFTSAATVSRSIKKCGLNGFMELRYIALNKNKKLKENKEYKSLNNILEKSLIEVTRTIENLSIKNIIEVINTINNSERIYILAQGMTKLVGEEFDFKLKLLGYNSFLITDPNIMKQITKTINKNETVIAFSLRGESPPLVDSLKNAKTNNCKKISFCCDKKSKISKLSDISLIGEKHTQTSIKDFEVSSRIPLQIMSRVIIDYLSENLNK